MRKTFLFIAGVLILSACNNKPAESTASNADSSATASPESKAPPQSEFADAKYADIGKQMIDKLSGGDIDGWTSYFADNAVYRWSSGDSLAGKDAITKYWKDRRTNVLDSLSFTNDIWLPLKVNTPQKGPDVKGIWLLSWYQTTAKYKTGKKLTFWVHTDLHFDNNDKVDILIQYLDKAPINAALGKK